MTARLLLGAAWMFALLPASSADSHVRSYPTEVEVHTASAGMIPGTVQAKKATCAKRRSVTVSDAGGLIGSDTSDPEGGWSVAGVPGGDVTAEVAKRTLKRTPTHKHRCKATSSGLVDVTAPLLSIDSPAAGAITGPEGSISYNAGDSVELECTMDDAPVLCDLAGPYPFALGDGEHTFELAGTDANENEGHASLTWNVDGAAPIVSDLAVSGGTSPNGTVSFTLDDDSAVLDVRIVLDGTSEFELGPATAGTSHFNFDYSVGPGAHSVEAYATDTWFNSGSGAAPGPAPAPRAILHWEVD